MRRLFKYRFLADNNERVYGPVFRFLGIDISLLVVGWLNDWRLIDLRIPCNYGMYLQLGPILLSIGWLQDDTIYDT